MKQIDLKYIFKISDENGNVKNFDLDFILKKIEYSGHGEITVYQFVEKMKANYRTVLFWKKSRQCNIFFLLKICRTYKIDLNELMPKQLS